MATAILFFFFTRTPWLFSLAFVYTNRVIYLGFLINLFFSLYMYVCVSYRRTAGVGIEHGHRQIKSKQHRSSSALYSPLNRGASPSHPFPLTPHQHHTSPVFFCLAPIVTASSKQFQAHGN